MSDIHEEIVLAKLSDYPRADSAKIIGRILYKLRKVVPNKEVTIDSLLNALPLWIPRQRADREEGASWWVSRGGTPQWD